VKTKNGKPDFSGIKPEVHITNCNLQKDKKGNTLYSVELEEDDVDGMMSMGSDVDGVSPRIHNSSYNLS